MLDLFTGGHGGMGCAGPTQASPPLHCTRWCTSHPRARFTQVGFVVYPLTHSSAGFTQGSSVPTGAQGTQKVIQLFISGLWSRLVATTESMGHEAHQVSFGPNVTFIKDVRVEFRNGFGASELAAATADERATRARALNMQ